MVTLPNTESVRVVVVFWATVLLFVLLQNGFVLNGGSATGAAEVKRVVAPLVPSTVIGWAFTKVPLAVTCEFIETCAPLPVQVPVQAVVTPIPPLLICELFTRAAS